MGGPVTMTCGSCQKTITTRTDKEMASMGWVLAIVLCVVGCWPCCLIPCCMDSMQATTHSCPRCNISVWLVVGPVVLYLVAWIVCRRQPPLAQGATSLCGWLLALLSYTLLHG